jgi:hypothetical protein
LPSATPLAALLSDIEVRLRDFHARTWFFHRYRRRFEEALRSIEKLWGELEVHAELEDWEFLELGRQLSEVWAGIQSANRVADNRLFLNRVDELLPTLLSQLSAIRVPPTKARLKGSGATALAPSGPVSVAKYDVLLPRMPPSVQMRRIPVRRYANSALLDPPTGRRLKSPVLIQPGQVIQLRLDIGKLSPDTDAEHAIPFPDQQLPPDVNLDVVVSSTDFAVSPPDNDHNVSTVIRQRLFLPGDGAAARTPDGKKYLNFLLRSPDYAGAANCRIGYYYKSFLVQSQKLTVPIGVKGKFTIKTDFTMSRDLRSLEQLPEKPRVSVLINANSDGAHQIVTRALGADLGADEGFTFAFKETAVRPTVEKLRRALTDRAPTRKQRSKFELEQDLRAIAPHGWTLFAQGPAQRFQELKQFRANPNGFVLQVLRPNTSDFMFPWAYVYDIPLDGPAFQICRLVKDWDGVAPLANEGMRTCPHAPHPPNVLCPFGFWGFRYTIEQLSSTDKPALKITAQDECTFVVAETQDQVDSDELSAHVNNLRAALIARFPKAQLSEGRDKASIKALLGQDLPLVYFYCHGQKANVIDPDTWLGVGKGEAISAKEFIGWVVNWEQTLNKLIWNDVRPLVFVNACHSVAVYPETLVSYLDAFVSTARASGVIGTEVKVNQAIAMDVAQRFFDRLMKNHSVEAAIRSVRMNYLASGNLTGLIYTPYCWSELAFQ